MKRLSLHNTLHCIAFASHLHWPSISGRFLFHTGGRPTIERAHHHPSHSSEQQSQTYDLLFGRQPGWRLLSASWATEHPGRQNSVLQAGWIVLAIAAAWYDGYTRLCSSPSKQVVRLKPGSGYSGNPAKVQGVQQRPGFVTIRIFPKPVPGATRLPAAT